MNFEFKSTFKQIIEFTTHRRVPVAITILMLNVCALLLMYIMYLSNLFLPAVYGSKPNGSRWILGFELAGLLWLLSTLHAFMILVMHLHPVRTAIHEFDKAVIIFRDAANEYTRVTTIKFYLIRIVLNNGLLLVLLN